MDCFSPPGMPFDYRYREIAKAMATFTPLMKYFSDATCFRGKRFGDMMYDWFTNFLDAHRDFKDDRLFTWVS